MKKNMSQLLPNQRVNCASSSALTPKIPSRPDHQLLTSYSLCTPPELFDLRCEYEVPRYVDLNNLDEDD